MGIPPLETRAGSPVRAGPWGGLDSDSPARGPASSACDSLLLLLPRLRLCSTASTWYTQPVVLRGYGIGSVTVALEPEAWRTRPWHPGLEFGWVWAWSLGLVAEGPDQPQSEERKG